MVYDDRDLPIKHPKKVSEELVNLFVPESEVPDAVLELALVFDESGVNVRELASYLTFVDKTYGRLTPRGIRSYAQRRDAQIEASFRRGSLETVITEVVQNKDLITALVLLRFVLKYLPAGIREVATAYDSYQAGALKRARRKQLRQEVNADEELAPLSKDRKNQLVRFIDDVYQRERERLSRAQRFAIYHVKKLVLRIRSEDDRDGE